MSSAAPPQIDLAGFDPLDPALEDLRHAYYAAMRERQPVYRVPGRDIFLITRYEQILAAVRDTATFSNKFHSPGLALGQGTAEIQERLDVIRADGYPQVPTMLTNDPPEHTRYRKLAQRAFTPKRIASWRPAIEAISEHLIDGFVADGEVELVERYAVPLPIGVIADALGVPRERQADFKRWSDDALSSVGAEVSDERRLQSARGLVEFQQYFAAELDDRRQTPRDDFLTDLVRARIDDDAGELDDDRPLDLPELLSILHQLLVAGNETTTSLIAETVRILAGRPELQQRVLADPDVIPSVIEEALRYVSPAQGMFRIAQRDIELDGVAIPAGATIVLMYASANRDACVFAEPDRFDPDRDNLKRHLSFGNGAHFCLGAPLSRLEVSIAIEQLCRRLGPITLDTRHRTTYAPGFVLRRPDSLHINFGGETR